MHGVIPSEHPTTSPGPEEQTKTCQIHGTCNEYYQLWYPAGFVSGWHSSKNMLRLTLSAGRVGTDAEIQREKTGVPGLEIASVNGTRRQATGPAGAMMSSTEYSDYTLDISAPLCYALDAISRHLVPPINSHPYFSYGNLLQICRFDRRATEQKKPTKICRK